VADAIDSARQTADNRASVGTQASGQAVGHQAAVSRRVTGSDHADRQGIFGSKIALKVQDQRGITDLGKQTGNTRIAGEKQIYMLLFADF